MSFALVILLTGCYAGKTGGSGRIAKYVEEFYTGEDGIQYFIKALDYEDANGEEAKVDFTFRNKNKETDSVTVNMTFLTKKTDTLHSIELSTDSLNKKTTDIVHFFTERKKEFYAQRSSLRISYNDFEKAFTDATHQLKLQTASETLVLKPTSGAIKSMNTIKLNKLDLLTK